MRGRIKKKRITENMNEEEEKKKVVSQKISRISFFVFVFDFKLTLL